MLESRRVRAVATVGALAAALGPSPARSTRWPWPRRAASRSWGRLRPRHRHEPVRRPRHGPRGASAGRIISFYYGGAQARPATLPATVRVGLLQANRDPSSGGRLGRVLVKGVEVPGGRQRPVLGGGRDPGRADGQADPQRPRHLVDQAGVGGHVGVRPVPAAVFGPTKAGTGVVVRSRPPCPRPGCRCPRPASSCAGAAWTSTWSATTRVSSARGRWP